MDPLHLFVQYAFFLNKNHFYFCSKIIKINSNSLCQILYCRRNSTTSICEGRTGAADGTLCESGKVCQLGVCSPKTNTRRGTCLFGDGLVTQEITGLKLTAPQMNCVDVFKLIEQAGQSISGFCSNDLFGDTCCQSCKSNLF